MVVALLLFILIVHKMAIRKAATIKILHNLLENPTLLEEKLYSSYSRPHHLFTIPVKDSYLFKIVESVFNFYLKLYNFKQTGVFY